MIISYRWLAIIHTLMDLCAAYRVVHRIMYKRCVIPVHVVFGDGWR